MTNMPFEEAVDNGIKGFGKGFVFGIIGLPLKPISSTLDGTQLFLQGFNNHIDGNRNKMVVKQARIPRMFYSHQRYIKDYNPLDSQLFKNLTQNEIFQNLIIYQSYLTKDSSNLHIILILSDDTLIYFLKNDIINYKIVEYKLIKFAFLSENNKIVIRLNNQNSLNFYTNNYKKNVELVNYLNQMIILNSLNIY